MREREKNAESVPSVAKGERTPKAFRDDFAGDSFPMRESEENAEGVPEQSPGSRSHPGKKTAA
jgi:hypothetical protein